MHGAVPGIVAAVAVALMTAAAANGNAEVLPIGQAHEWHIEGNPATGYTWQYNGDQSDNPGIVEVESLGYGEPVRGEEGMVGRPAPFIFRLTCLQPGTAELRFVYVSPAGAPSREHEHRVSCE